MGENKSFLTDGTGISAFTTSKFVKDIVVDLLLSGSAALAVVNIVDVGAALAQPTVIAMTLTTVVIKVIYRNLLRWASA